MIAHRSLLERPLGRCFQPDIFPPFFLFSLKHTQNPLLVFLEPSSLPKKNIVFLVNFLVRIDSALSSLAAMSAPLPRPSASAGDRRRRLPPSTSSSPPPLPPQSPPLSARHRYHRHRCGRCSVSAATARCCRRCCRCCCRRRRHHLQCRFSF